MSALEKVSVKDLEKTVPTEQRSGEVMEGDSAKKSEKESA